MPIKSTRVRKRDVPYMTAEWRMAIRMKRRSAKRYNKNKTEENRGIMKVWRNEASSLRRIAIQDYRRRTSTESKKKSKEILQDFHAFSQQQNGKR